MNCKPGDLAIVIYDYLGIHQGKIITCRHIDTTFQTSWTTSPELRDKNGCLCVVDDRDLRPIRDQDGEDEILRIAGKPNKENVDG